MVREKVRIRFRKTGDLRLISHHDLMRCFERLLRRAAIPYHSTSGFNPKPRLVFALSLPLGIVGSDEVAELELDEEVGAEAIRDRLNYCAPPGLAILAVRKIEPRTTAHVTHVIYQVAIPAQRHQGLSERLAALLAASHCWWERQRPRPRRLDLRPYLRDLRQAAGDLVMDLAVTPTGTARPDEVLALLGLEDLLEAGTIVERTRVELEDEGVATVLADAGLPQGANDLPNRAGSPEQECVAGRSIIRES